MAYLPITDHGLIGDLHTAGLVGCDGRLVWLPWPNFASPSIFAAILDDARGGDWLLAPTQISAAQQRYDDETAILITSFETPTGRAELWDWMSPYDGEAPGHDLCRLLRCVAGEVTVAGRFAPRPDYARAAPELRAAADGIQLDAHGQTLHLRSSQPWRIDGERATLETTLRIGEELQCVLCSGDPLLALEQIPADLQQTRRYWQRWLAQCSYDGLWQAMVRRSAITLKLLTYAPTGAIVAAPTTSLPEWIGGIRNWDYRYTWLRDASFTLDALCALGFHEEESRFFDWLTALAQRHDSPLQIMHGIHGETELTEIELPHLEGYRRSAPVRIGNGAFDQRQLDVYGGVIDAAFRYTRHQNVLHPAAWLSLRDEIDYVCAHWQEPDQGIWEMRAPPQQHTFSKLMCWVTLDRGIGLAENQGWDYDRERWTQTRASIRESILQYAFNPAANAFTQSYGSEALDASVLMLPIFGFLPPDDPRVLSTIARIKQELARGALVYRYRVSDALPSDEGAFLLCSYWLIAAQALVGQLDEALTSFETLLSFASSHGLLSEEVDPATGAALGNYPQAFSHIGLINSAVLLTQLTRQRSGDAPSAERSA
jgi:GH15 family glucan-1,4-alpha-glucosidase